MLPSASNKSLISENLKLLHRPSVFNQCPTHLLLPSVAMPLKVRVPPVSKGLSAKPMSSHMHTEQSPAHAHISGNKDLVETLCNYGEVQLA